MEARFNVPSSRVVTTWILLLAGAQVADVLTTGVDMAYGGVEANRFVVSLLALGGLGLVFFMKLMLVAAMAIACVILKRYAQSHPSRQARAAHAFVWRAIQISVLGLVVVAVHNTALLALIT
jgi:hypothetical protein